MILPIAAGLGILGFLLYSKRPTGGVRLSSGEQAIITSYITPAPTADQWMQVAQNPVALATLIAPLFPLDGPLQVNNVTPAPAAGHYSVVVEAKRSTTYKPRSKTVGPYTFTDEAARKVD